MTESRGAQCRTSGSVVADGAATGISDAITGAGQAPATQPAPAQLPAGDSQLDSESRGLDSHSAAPAGLRDESDLA